MENQRLQELIKNYFNEETNISSVFLSKYQEKSRFLISYAVYLEKVFDLSKDYHVHDEYEILYVLEGRVLYNIIDKQYILNPGDMILIPNHTLHKIANPNEKTKRIVLSFSDEYIKYFSTPNTNLLSSFIKINDTNIHKISFTDQYKKRIENELKQLCELFTSNDYGSDILYNLKFAQVMLLINYQFESIKEDFIPNSDDNIISKITKYIDKNIEKKITLSDLSKITSLSISRLSHLFKEKTGITIMSYIIKKRLVTAKELLKKGISIYDVSTQCGFQDYTSFFRTFKKEYFMTPRQFILRNKMNS